jgi:C-terminal processing protease CtpA/Prc
MMNTLTGMLRVIATVCLVVTFAAPTLQAGTHKSTVRSPLTQSGTRYFPETGYLVQGRFLSYWQDHGDLPQFGYPVSPEFQERSDTDGNIYTVQYFERSVFEYHPENANTHYEVLLAQLGTTRYHALYVLQFPPDIAVPIPPTMSPQALSYLREALDFIQMHFIGRDKFDWVTIRTQAFALANRAQTPADTYNAIYATLESLKDLHAGLRLPNDNPYFQAPIPTLGIFANYESRTVAQVAKNSLGDNAGVQVGDVIEQINGKTIDSLDASHFFVELYSGSEVQLLLRRESEPNPVEITITHNQVDSLLIPHGRQLSGNLGYIALPTNQPPFIVDQYAGIGQQIIKDIDQTPTCGWVVDLQYDGGGSLSPMILAVAPVLGDGELGKFISMDGTQAKWILQNGHFYYDDTLSREVDNPYQLKRPMPPVAVLISASTASAGEATLIAFKGRSDTRVFGQPSAGVPTSRRAHSMPDGAYISVSNTLESDRTGRVYGYDERIRPDQYVTPNYRYLGSDNDPLVQAAIPWISSQPGCAR